MHEQVVEHRELRTGEQHLTVLGAVADAVGQGSTVEHPPGAVEPAVREVHHDRRLAQRGADRGHRVGRPGQAGRGHPPGQFIGGLWAYRGDEIGTEGDDSFAHAKESTSLRPSKPPCPQGNSVVLRIRALREAGYGGRPGTRLGRSRRA